MNNLRNIEKLDEQINMIKQKLADPKLCEGTAEIYSRISGYYRPVSAYNDGKAQEFMQRVEYRFD